MRALLVGESGGEHPALTTVDIPDPEPGRGEVLVRVTAAGVNRADRLQRAGRYRQPALARPGATVAGMEVVGVVEALGPSRGEAAPISVGDRVMAMCGGSYAELAVVPAGLLLPVPDAVPDEDAAALPVALMTAYDALVRAGRFAQGESVLVTAAASAIGLGALAVARLLGASRVFGTSRSSRGLAAIASAGGQPVVAEAVAALRDRTDGRGIDVAVDHVGGDIAADALSVLARGGRLVSVGRLGGQRIGLDLNHLARERLTVVGATFRTRSLAEYVEIADGVRERLLPHVADGSLRLPISTVRPLARANDVLDMLDQERPPGKIVLRVRS